MNRINEEKKKADLEYSLICDFINLRKELGLTQKNWEKHLTLLGK